MAEPRLSISSRRSHHSSHSVSHGRGGAGNIGNPPKWPILTKQAPTTPNTSTADYTSQKPQAPPAQRTAAAEAEREISPLRAGNIILLIDGTRLMRKVWFNRLGKGRVTRLDGVGVRMCILLVRRLTLTKRLEVLGMILLLILDLRIAFAGGGWCLGINWSIWFSGRNLLFLLLREERESGLGRSWCSFWSHEGIGLNTAVHD